MALLKIKHRATPAMPEYIPQQKYHDNSAIADVVAYVTQEDKTPSTYIGGIAVNPYCAAYEMEAVSVYNAQDHGVRLRHMILSFSKKELARSKGVAQAAAYKFAYEIAQYYGDRHQIIFAVHEDTDDVHVHFIMNTTNYLTGQKYGGKKADYYHFLDYINAILNPYGIFVWPAKDIPAC